MRVCESCDGCEEILIFFKDVKHYFTNLSLPIKKFNNEIIFLIQNIFIIFILV